MKVLKFLPALCISTVFAFSLNTAHAAITIVIEQVGNDVVATTSGSFDTDGFTSLVNDNYENFRLIRTISTRIGVGGEENGGAFGGFTAWEATIMDGPDLGSVHADGTNARATISHGDFFAVYFGGGPSPYDIMLPQGYSSGDPISGTSTWTDSVIGNTTDAGVTSLNLTPGSYTFTWTDDGVRTLDTVTVNVIPEPSSALMICVGALGFLVRRKR